MNHLLQLLKKLPSFIWNHLAGDSLLLYQNFEAIYALKSGLVISACIARLGITRTLLQLMAFPDGRQQLNIFIHTS